MVTRIDDDGNDGGDKDNDNDIIKHGNADIQWQQLLVFDILLSTLTISVAFYPPHYKQSLWPI